jgi:RNA-binding protein Luc7-like 2
LGEAGKIDEVATLLEEVEKFKKQKNDLEALIDNNVISQDKNMKVCEICGALQSALDTGKRLTMHLEGKLHTGYLKIRNKLAELKIRRNRGDSPRRDSRV